jgi:hypothetical protein
VICRRDSRRQNADTILSFGTPTKHFCMFLAFHDFHFVATTHEVFENYTKFSDLRFFFVAHKHRTENPENGMRFPNQIRVLCRPV